MLYFCPPGTILRPQHLNRVIFPVENFCRNENLLFFPLNNCFLTFNSPVPVPWTTRWDVWMFDFYTWRKKKRFSHSSVARWLLIFLFVQEQCDRLGQWASPTSFSAFIHLPLLNPVEGEQGSWNQSRLTQHRVPLYKATYIEQQPFEPKFTLLFVLGQWFWNFFFQQNKLINH